MVNLKGIVGSITNGLAKFLFKGMEGGMAFDPKDEEMQAESKPLLITPESNPELIQAVVAELQATDAHMLLEQMQNLEKAVYHMAARQVQGLEHQKILEETMVSMATTLDEMLHGMSQAMDQQEESDEEALEDAWDSKKSQDHLN